LDSGFGIDTCACKFVIAINNAEKLLTILLVWKQDGASETEINLLPKYRFCRIGPSEKNNSEKSPSYGGVMTLICGESTSEQVLGAEDAECCICLSAYEDGVELYELPCNHHFHCGCIAKWLRINATCPLCKYNVVKNDDNGSEDVWFIWCFPLYGLDAKETLQILEFGTAQNVDTLIRIPNRISLDPCT